MSKRSVRYAHELGAARYEGDGRGMDDGCGYFPTMRLALSLRVIRAHSARYACCLGGDSLKKLINTAPCVNLVDSYPQLKLGSL